MYQNASRELVATIQHERLAEAARYRTFKAAIRPKPARRIGLRRRAAQPAPLYPLAISAGYPGPYPRTA